MVCLFVFFFQAEDGIRDLVRSRGLGDVYKRQLDGRSVIYRNAWNSVDIIYEMRGESIKEVIVLKLSLIHI